jgi:hypothetical protein
VGRAPSPAVFEIYFSGLRVLPAGKLAGKKIKVKSDGRGRPPHTDSS